MNRVFVIAAAAAGVAFAAGVFAAEAPSDRPNKPPISVADLEARAAERFAAIDANGDGVVDAQEFAAHDPEPWGKSRMHGQPKGGRGFEPSPEARAEFETGLYDALDRNADGSLSREEFAAQTEVRAALHKQRMFERLDGNDDGLLDKNEFPPRRAQDLDTDGDGQISREEMRRLHRGAEG